MKQVVLTGYGAVHSLGFEHAAFEASYLNPPSSPPPLLGEFPYKRWFPKSSKRLKKMDMVGKFASCAALFASQSAGLGDSPPAILPALDIGLVTGSMFGGLEACVAFHKDLVEKGADAINPVNFPNTSHNVACGHVAITLGIHGPMTSLVSGMTSGHQAVLNATRTLRHGRAKVMFVGGYDRLIPELQEATAQENLSPAEGACFLVLEEEQSAQDRGAKILGKVLGFGQASEPLDRCQTNPEGLALSRALQLALRQAKISRPDGLVLGTQGVADFDQAVEAGYQLVLGEEFSKLPTFRPKLSFGETFGAAGTFAVAATHSQVMRKALPPGKYLMDGYSRGGTACGLVIEF